MNSFDPTKVLSFDLETTSANPFEARIVTSALVRIDAQGAHPTELLADPGVEIPEAAAKVHGISTEYAREHGKPHAEVLAHTIDAIRQAWDQGYCLVVYNAAYDLTVLNQLEPSFYVTGPVYDPFVMDKVLDPYRKGKRTLSDVCEHYHVKIDNAHEATSDALAAARVAWKQAKQVFAEEIGSKSLDQLMEFQAVQYFESQQRFAEYLKQQGKDASTVNTSWPMQSR
ncbi:3'-5' exonuclease [Corynebacterium pseudopelargi]|uniref:DNA polymerase III subunit epsilon n=1 Tax=Corynebacterium pseudopelargi TaxID=2080757 RepID=A0A3G6IXR9_9CORY|nr:3'-5' exonuclease [Corynebacterium pseudopelargi]AZA09448.1 DNA polymerase III subunit epsilon [Corynebacterium pseudopelargi]